MSFLVDCKQHWKTINLFIVKYYVYISFINHNYFQSEGPIQVALLMIRFLQLFLRDVSPDKWDCFFLAYSNMCNIDRLKLLQSPLALPGDFSMV